MWFHFSGWCVYHHLFFFVRSSFCHSSAQTLSVRTVWQIWDTHKRPVVHERGRLVTQLCLDGDQRPRSRKKENQTLATRGREETQRRRRKPSVALRDRCSPQGEPPLTRLPHKLFCSFRLHSKVVELGYKIISQATCLSSLAVQLANWREWFPVWATIQNMAVKIWMMWRLSRSLSPSLLHFSNIFLFHRQDRPLTSSSSLYQKLVNTQWHIEESLQFTSQSEHILQEVVL